MPRVILMQAQFQVLLTDSLDVKFSCPSCSSPPIILDLLNTPRGRSGRLESGVLAEVDWACRRSRIKDVESLYSELTGY